MTNELELDATTRADMMALIERLARRYAALGYRHPRVAAVAVVMRGVNGVDQQAWAAHLGVDPAEIDASESGLVAMADLSPKLADRIRAAGLAP